MRRARGTASLAVGQPVLGQDLGVRQLLGDTLR